MPGTGRRDRPVYRASKSWDYVSSDSLGSTDNPTLSATESAKDESEDRSVTHAMAPPPGQMPASMEPHTGIPNTESSLENIVSVLSEEQSVRSLAENKKIKEDDDGRLAGTLYAIILSILGIVFPLKEIFQRQWLEDYTIAVYYIYLYGVSFIFLLGLEIYIIVRVRKEPQTKDEAKPGVAQLYHTHHNDMVGEANMGYEDDVTHDPHEPGKITIIHNRQLSRTSTGDDLFYIQTRDWNPPGNYRTSLYLRIAIIVLGLATIIYDGLLIKEYSEISSDVDCGRNIFYWPHCVHLAFLLVQTYFLFKHPQIQVVSFRKPIRLGFMHVFASNWCMAFRTFVQQISNNLDAKETSELHAVNGTASPTAACGPDDPILRNAAPYLYPCVYEYSLLAGAIIYGMFMHNLGPPGREEGGYGEQQTTERRPHLSEINCHHTHKGLFLGMVLLAGTCTGIILFFSYLHADPTTAVPLLIYQVADVTLHFAVLLLVIVSTVQMRKLTYSPDAEGYDIASVLLLIAMSSSLFLYIFKLMALAEHVSGGGSSTEQILAICASVLSILVALAQTGFVMQSLCRYTLTDEQYEQKHGRGCITCLLITNIALWFFKTFQMKALELETVVYESSYGYLPWQIISHASVPLVIFYYLHCSACLATVWGQAYRHADRVPGTKSRLNSTNSILSTPVKYLHVGEMRHRAGARKLNMNDIPVDNIISPISDV